MQVIPSIDLRGGRSRLVWWPGAAAGTGTPTDRPDRIAEQFVELGARIDPPRGHGRRRAGAAGEPRGHRGRVAARVAVPLQLAGGVDEADQVELAFAAGATRVVLSVAIAERPQGLRECLAVAGDWLAVGLDARPDRIAEYPWKRTIRPPSMSWWRSWSTGASAASC